MKYHALHFCQYLLTSSYCNLTSHNIGLSSNKLVLVLREKVVAFRSHLPTVSCLLNPELRLRHWEAIQRDTGEDIAGDHNSVTIHRLQEMKVRGRRKGGKK